MITIPIRDLQQLGAKAVEEAARTAGQSADEPMLVTGRPGPLFYLIPVDTEHLEQQGLELRRAMARGNLRAWQQRAVAAGLDRLTDADIDEEIAAARRERRRAAEPGATYTP
jgi:hypothetical protein